MTENSPYSMIPRTELKCVWMEAGVVGFKLCDRFMQCDECPFDSIIRQHAFYVEGPCISGDSSEGPDKHLGEDQLHAFLTAFERPDLPQDRMYYSNHTWYKRQTDESVVVGLDHLAAFLLDSVHCLVLPHTPVHTQKFSPCLWVVEHEGAIAFHTPLAGVISVVNDQLTEIPALVTTRSYGEGWLFVLKPENEAGYYTELFDADRAKEVFHAQGKNLQSEIGSRLARIRATVGTTYYDGGTKVAGLRNILGSRSYFEIISRILTAKK